MSFGEKVNAPALTQDMDKIMFWNAPGYDEDTEHNLTNQLTK